MIKLFLSASWQHLAMINYEIDPAVLKPFVPTGVELDSWNGKTFVSVVGFRFLNTKLQGMGIPFHTDFEEINLRFYVRYKDGQGWKRGVVFIKEIVAQPAISYAARLFYNENYVALPTTYEINKDSVRYSWKFNGQLNYLLVKPTGDRCPVKENSLEEFITEHYWGYTRQRNNFTTEYEVKHPRWNIWDVSDAAIKIDVERLYGREFTAALAREPSSAFLADGSDVEVFSGRKI